jgi:hypothetical protein
VDGDAFWARRFANDVESWISRVARRLLNWPGRGHARSEDLVQPIRRAVLNCGGF